jgi:hypothetical protein
MESGFGDDDDFAEVYDGENDLYSIVIDNDWERTLERHGSSSQFDGRTQLPLTQIGLIQCGSTGTRKPRGTGDDARSDPHDHYAYKEKSFSFNAIMKMVGPVRNTVIWDVVNYISTTLGPRVKPTRMAKRRLAVAYHFLDEYEEEIQGSLLREAVDVARAKAKEKEETTAQH